MKSKYLLQLLAIVVFAVSAMAFLHQKQSKKVKRHIKTSCQQNCNDSKHSTDNPDDIFFNPFSHMIVAVYK
ncbi:MAG: hypothetical protein KGL19_03155 [Bacteroidota bacterium]|nr:hypothetical protein [Bacteroidota bacterium]